MLFSNSNTPLSSHGIRVSVQSHYIPEKSNPTRPYYFFAYHVNILNESSLAVKLLRRYWLIRDAFGRKEEVYGEGVVGEQPVIAPEMHYKYTSFCPLATNFGTMLGAYTMEDEKGNKLKVDIATFQLLSPQAMN